MKTKECEVRICSGCGNLAELSKNEEYDPTLTAVWCQTSGVMSLSEICSLLLNENPAFGGCTKCPQK